ncbi:MAG: IS630 family transposase [bacterium]
MKNTKQDGRKISPKTQEEIRVRAVQRVQAGESPEDVIKTLGFSRACIYNWLADYRSGGWHALRTGQRTGRKRKLDGTQIKWLYKTIRDKDPQQLKFEFALWTRAMIVELIKRQFGITISPTSVGRLLIQMGFTCQKPLYRAYQRDPEAVQQWKEKEFPEIQKRAKKEKAVIFFEDESGIRSDAHAGKTWALKGKTPVIESTGARFGLNMIAAITPKGEMNFMLVQGSVQAVQVCDFLKRLMKGRNQKVFLIWDGHPTHKSKKVKKCIESFNGQLEVFFLPSYSPDLNPIEQLWNHTKSNGAGRKAIKGPNQLKAAVAKKLRSLQKLPRIIASFFRHPDCLYIHAFMSKEFCTY